MDMPASLSYQPIRLSRNPIIVNVPALVQPGLVDRTGLRYSLELLKPVSYQSSTYDVLTTLPGFEEPAETIAGVQVFPGAKFEVQDQLDGLLRLQAPKFGQLEISICPDLTSPFVTKAFRFNNGVPVDQLDYVAAWVMKGAMDERYFAEWGDRLFSEPSGLAGKFVTWKPNGSSIRPDQPEYLYFLTNMVPTPKELKVRMEVIYSDGSSETRSGRTFKSVTAFSVYCLPAGPVALGLDQLVKEVESYKIWLVNENAEQVSEAREYFLNYEYRSSERFILFNGSLGNFDCLALIGKGTETLKVSRQTVERYPDEEMLPTYSERVINSVTGDREMTVATGWISKDQAEYLSELLYAREIYLVTDREHLPLLLVNESLETSADERDLVGYSFTFRYTNPITGFSKLPTAPARIEQPSAWRAFDYGSCVLDAAGKRTGMRKVSMLEKYYIQTLQPVIPQQLKPNVPGTEGYIEAIPSLECQKSPYNNAAISREGTYRRTTCGNGLTGGTATITVEAGKYGSELSQVDADAKAESEWQRLNTQANADLYGACLAGPQSYALPVPAGRVNFRFSPNLAGGSSFVVGGAADGSNTELIFTNGWPWQGNQNPNSIILPVGTNDMKLPSSLFANSTPGLQVYRIGVYSSLEPRTVRVYVNGNLIYTGMNQDFQYHWPTWGVVPDQACIYIEMV